MSKLILGRYTTQGLWSLFLMCALPLHVWTMLLAFRDLSWLTDRTNAWDAVGVLCYGLVFALAESVLAFIVTAIAGLLVPARWDSARRVTLLGMLFLVLALWAMVTQLFFLANARLPDAVIGFLVRSPHPLWIMYGTLIVLISATCILPVWAIARQGRGLKFLQAAMERLGLLAMFYLVFDAVAVVIVVLRNL